MVLNEDMTTQTMATAAVAAPVLDVSEEEGAVEVSDALQLTSAIWIGWLDLIGIKLKWEAMGKKKKRRQR